MLGRSVRFLTVEHFDVSSDALNVMHALLEMDEAKDEMRLAKGRSARELREWRSRRKKIYILSAHLDDVGRSEHSDTVVGAQAAELLCAACSRDTGADNDTVDTAPCSLGSVSINGIADKTRSVQGTATAASQARLHGHLARPHIIDLARPRHHRARRDVGERQVFTPL